MATIRWFPAEELRQLKDTKVGSDSPRRQIFDDALQELESVSNGEQSTVKWVVRVGPEFIEELRKDDSVAIMIFMHWSVLLHRLDDTWWKRFSGRRLVEDLSISFGRHGEEWDKLAIWCREQVVLPA